MGAIYRFNLPEIVKKHNIKYFVETGTLYGDGVDFVLKSIGDKLEKLYSIELLTHLAEKAKIRFSGLNKVQIHQGLSVDILKDLLPLLDGNTLFWLDAHFPGADIKQASYYQPDKEEKEVIPLEEELNLIFNLRKSFKDVIICDDLWLYEDGEYETEARTIDNHLRKYCNGETRAQIGKPNSNFLNKFLDTHNLIKSRLDQGYALLYPK